MKLNEIICDLPIKKIIGSGDKNVHYLSCRTDNIKSDTMFFCLCGKNVDGHIFAKKVIVDGATVIVTQKELGIDPTVATQIIVENTRAFMALAAKNFYFCSSDKMKMIGVTGTNGKTSTTYILKSIFENQGINVGVLGTNGVWINNVHYNTQLTTPDPIELHQWLYKMYLNGVEYVIMEVSAHALALDKVNGITFEISVLTNFSHDHLDYFENIKKYADAKLKLFKPTYSKVAVVNGDDKLGRYIAQNEKIPTITYGVSTPCDVFAIDDEETEEGIKYTINLCDEVARLAYKLQGKFNVYNTLCASAVARLLGIKLEEITQGIDKVRCIDGRNEVYQLKNGCRVIVDFAHTPEGFSNILAYLKSTTKGKLICVFGCGGDRDKLKRPLMAKEVSRVCDYAIITNDNPRYEKPQTIIKDIEQGMKIAYDVIEDRQTAILHAINMSQNFDTVAILGKGAEKYQEQNGRKYPFCDADVVKRFVN